jgi:hypothetical protein
MLMSPPVPCTLLPVAGGEIAARVDHEVAAPREPLAAVGVNDENPSPASATSSGLPLDSIAPCAKSVPRARA